LHQISKYGLDEDTNRYGVSVKYTSVKYYGPTMGKTTAAKNNPYLVDFDTIVRDRIKRAAEAVGLSVREYKMQGSS